jgi:hypothetical protein
MPPRRTSTTWRYTGYRTPTWRTTRTTTGTTGTTTGTTTTYACNSPKFRTVRQECQWRITSYRNVYTQITGPGTKTIFSPTTANKWVRYVNTGVRVFKFTNTEFTRHFGTTWTTRTPKAAWRYLRTKYGPGIKDVTRGKGNCWLVATTKTVTTRPFSACTCM